MGLTGVLRWRGAPVAAVAAFTAALAALHVGWLYHFRRQLPVDIDEAGYLSFGLDYLNGWRRAGIEGLWTAVSDQGQFAPLVPLSAAPLMGWFGERPGVAMCVQLLFLAVLAVASFGLGAALGGRWAGVVAAAVTLLAPVVVDFTRTFHFVVAATAFLALATCALVRSRGFAHLGWVVVAGAATGLMLLSRTYTLAFLPALGLASLVILWSAADRRRALANAALGGVVTVVVAGWWWIPNRRAILGYLTDFGYGDAAAEYASDAAPGVASLSFWTARLSHLLGQGLYLGCAVAILAALVLWGCDSFAARRSGRRYGPPAGVLRVLASPFGVVAIVFMGCYAALTSSANEGFGFIGPLVPLAVCLGVGAVWRLAHPLRAVLAGALLVSVAIPAIGKATLTGPASTYRCVTIPSLGCVPVTNGAPLELTSPDPDAARAGLLGQWARVGDDAVLHVLDALASPGAPTFPHLVFASRDPLFNTNTFNLAWLVRFGSRPAVAQVLPEPDQRFESYRRQFDERGLAAATFLVATDVGPNEYEPVVDQDAVERVAGCAGFVLVDSWRLPDGRGARLYQRAGAPSEPNPGLGC